jgi:FixJ family two-component response regulator
MTAEAGLVHVVDDEEEVCRSTAALLRTAGIECRTWPSGDSFLDGADLGGDGCVILDLRMRGKDGFDVQQELTTLRSPLKVILVTGHADAVLARKAIAAGAIDLIAKPYEHDVLLVKVEEALAITRT